MLLPLHLISVKLHQLQPVEKLLAAAERMLIDTKILCQHTMTNSFLAYAILKLGPCMLSDQFLLSCLTKYTRSQLIT